MTQKKHLNTINQKAKIYLSKKIFFSLVELTMILAILSVLCSLLMPSLNKVMANQQTLKCANNLKEINLALEGFLNDHNDQYPMPDDWLVTWDDQLGLYDGRDIAPSPIRNPTSGGFEVDNYAPGKFGLYLCPKDPSHSTGNEKKATRSYAANQSAPSANTNGSLRGIISDIENYRTNNPSGRKERWSMHRVMIKQPSSTIALTEIAPYGGKNHILGGNRQDTVVPSKVRDSFQQHLDKGTLRHGNQGFMQNYLMVDGSIKLLHLQETRGNVDKDMLTTTKNHINQTQGTLWDARK